MLQVVELGDMEKTVISNFITKSCRQLHFL